MTHLSGQAVRWGAPGRVNVIGEHTDYNEGFALPFAIEASCTATATALEQSLVRVRSVQEQSVVEVPLDGLAPGRPGWAAYPLGVVWALQQLGRSVRASMTGIDLVLDSDVPTGAGLSSSAALVCSTTTALDELFGLELDDATLLAVSRRAENDYVGAPTGGMDQLASLRCTAGNVLFCDMRTLEVEQVPFDVAAAGLSVLVLDTRAPHAHADGEYGRRRAGCERAAKMLGVRALRDITADELDGALGRLPDGAEGEELRRYVRHIVTEDDRVLRTVELLRRGRLRDIGELLTKSHISMRDDYQITIPELDVAVDVLLDAGALGARMTGGGFGGCVIALIEASTVDAAVAAVGAAYEARDFRPPVHLTTRPAQGAHRI